MTAKRKRKPAKPKKPAVLAPQADPSDPGGSGVALVYMPRPTAGVRVTEDTAMTQSAVWACVRCISESLATLPCHVYKKRPKDGQDVLPDHPVDWLLTKQANPETPAFYFREAMVAWALTWGNGFAEIERDLAGRPLWLWQLTPDRVCVERVDLDTVLKYSLARYDIAPGDLAYKVDNYAADPTYLPAADVVHLRGLGFDGLVGYPVIRMAARSIGAAIAGDTATSDYFQNDSTPGGVLKHPGKLSDPARDNLRKSWQERHGGPSRRRTVAILEEGLDWVQTGLPPGDSQLLQQRQFAPAEIARWFRVPPHMIGDLSRATFSNIESQQIQFVTDCLMPWAERFEQELNVKLFGRTNRGTVYAEHDFKGRLRGDTAAQTSHLQQMLDRGLYSINDGRDYLGLNPIGPDGDKRFVQSNMTLLEKAGEEPPAPTPPAGGGPPGNPDNPPPDDPNADPAGDGAAADDQQMAGWRHVMLDACGRVGRREERLVAEARRRNAPPAAWVAGFLPKHLEFFREAVAAPAFGLALALAAGDEAIKVAAVAVEVSTQALAVQLGATLPAAFAADAKWQADPGALALDLIRGLRAAVASAKGAA